MKKKSDSVAQVWCLFKLMPGFARRREYALSVLLVLSLATDAFCHAAGDAAAQGLGTVTERPNIVFLLADDLAAGAVGYIGNKDVSTPNIDRLAADGIRFLKHYDTTSICMASRCSIMTGLYEYRHGCNFSHGPLAPSLMDNAYPLVLKRAGYFTGFAGKIGFDLKGESFESFSALFDVWAGGPGQTFYETSKNKGIASYSAAYPHCSRAYGAWACDFLRSAKQSGKPFCLSVSFKAPHMPYTPDPLDMKLYEGKTFSRPRNFGVEKGAHLSPQVHTSRAATSYREWVDDFDGVVAKYYALITGVDAAVGMIRDELARLGVERNTVIILTSDNGYNAGSHGFGDKVIPYEEASKAPLLIYDPRLPSSANGKNCEALTGNVDVAATILALGGQQATSEMDGKSLLPLLSDPEKRVREYLPLFNFWGVASAQSMAVVSEEWKYIYWFYGDNSMHPTEELFHLGSDPLEMRNVVADQSNMRVLEELRGIYDTQLADVSARFTPSQGYEPYGVLFSRLVPWELKQKALEKMVGQSQDSEAGGAGNGKNRRRGTVN